MKGKRPMAALALAAALLSGCSTFGEKKTTELKVSPQLPSTEGAVDTRKTKNSNYKLSLSIHCMPKPQRLTPPAQTYVVWTRNTTTPNAPAQNIGALQATKKMTATLDTITPLDQFDLWITTEANAEVVTPSGSRLLWASVFAR